MRTLHVGLRVADLERSLAFYTGVGYEVLGEVPRTSFGSLTMLKLPGDPFVSIELVHDPARGAVEPGGLNHLVVHVPALHELVAGLAARGIEAEPPSSPGGTGDLWTAWLTDPDGYRIELVQWPPGHPEGMTAADLADEESRPPGAPRVLVIGLDPYRVTGPWDPEPVARGIEAGRARFAEHGVGAEFCLVGLDGSDDVDAVVAAALTSRAWECVVVGGGVRGDTGLLERVLNLVHRHAPAAAIAFNETPDATYDAAARHLGAP
jgi:lactoylglutathione lyase